MTAEAIDPAFERDPKQLAEEIIAVEAARAKSRSNGATHQASDSTEPWPQKMRGRPLTRRSLKPTAKRPTFRRKCLFASAPGMGEANGRCGRS